MLQKIVMVLIPYVFCSFMSLLLIPCFLLCGRNISKLNSAAPLLENKRVLIDIQGNVSSANVTGRTVLSFMEPLE